MLPKDLQDKLGAMGFEQVSYWNGLGALFRRGNFRIAFKPARRDGWNVQLGEGSEPGFTLPYKEDTTDSLVELVSDMIQGVES